MAPYITIDWKNSLFTGNGDTDGWCDICDKVWQKSENHCQLTSTWELGTSLALALSSQLIILATSSSLTLPLFILAGARGNPSVFLVSLVGRAKGLPPEESETATPCVGYRFFPSRVSDISGRYHQIWMEVWSRDKIISASNPIQPVYYVSTSTFYASDCGISNCRQIRKELGS